MGFLELIILLLVSIIPARMARKKGRSFWGYFFLGFIASPIVAMIVIALLNPLPTAQEPSAQSGAQQPFATPTSASAAEPPKKRCAYCDSILSENETVCRHCGAAVP